MPDFQFFYNLRATQQLINVSYAPTLNFSDLSHIEKFVSDSQNHLNPREISKSPDSKENLCVEANEGDKWEDAGEEKSCPVGVVPF